MAVGQQMAGGRFSGLLTKEKDYQAGEGKARQSAQCEAEWKGGRSAKTDRGKPGGDDRRRTKEGTGFFEGTGTGSRAKE